MGYGPEKTFEVVYISNQDWREHVIFVRATDRSDASYKAQQELRPILHTIQSIREVG